jgi:hypothetical protein
LPKFDERRQPRAIVDAVFANELGFERRIGRYSQANVGAENALELGYDDTGLHTLDGLPQSVVDSIDVNAKKIDLTPKPPRIEYYFDIFRRYPVYPRLRMRFAVLLPCTPAAPMSTSNFELVSINENS